MGKFEALLRVIQKTKFIKANNVETIRGFSIQTDKYSLKI